MRRSKDFNVVGECDTMVGIVLLTTLTTTRATVTTTVVGVATTTVVVGALIDVTAYTINVVASDFIVYIVVVVGMIWVCVYGPSVSCGAYVNSGVGWCFECVFRL